MATQKKAMEVLSKYVLAPNAFESDAQVFPYLVSPNAVVLIKMEMVMIIESPA